MPVIEAIKERFDVAVSLDTYKTGVAREGIKAGADMINDVWGFKWGKRIWLTLVAETRGGSLCNA